MTIYENIAAYYDRIFLHTPQKTEFFISRFGDSYRGAKHLDLGCGTGELVLDLVTRGVTATGLDGEAEMIEWARQKGAERKLSYAPDFRVGDIRNCGEQFPAASFDGISCLGNTLVHLSSEAEIGTFIAGVKKILKSKGTLSVQIVNYERIFETQSHRLPDIDNELLRFERYYDYGPDRSAVTFRTVLTIKQTGESREQSSRLYPLMPDRLVALCRENGFVLEGMYENFAATPFDRESMSLLLRVTRE
jgi:glycine/sarcosine N-methyltransferase